MDKPEYRSVGKSVRKKDSLQLLLGKPVYTEDIAPDALVVKLLRSPHANAMVKTIDTSKAKEGAWRGRRVHLGGRAQPALLQRRSDLS